MISIASILAFAIKQKALKREKEINQLIILQNAKLLSINNKKKKIIGIASHDLSTPFASIDMWNQLLKNSSSNWDEDQKKSFDMTREALAYGQKLLRKIVELENIIPDKICLDSFDFGAFVNAIVENIRSSSNKDIQWSLKIAKPTYLLSDMALIKKMCEYILGNAVNNLKENGVINVNLYSENDEIVFQVKNNPEDISKNKLPNLFSDYKELAKDESNETSRLAFAQRIVEELDGSIASKIENDNSVIIVKFKN